MGWLEEKYIGSVSTRLSMFKRLGDGTYNFRCFVCGDSRKSKTKARGYLLRKDSKYGYFCHNCNVSMSFTTFLKTLDNNLYNEFIRERFKENSANTTHIVEPLPDISKFITPKFIKYTALSNLKKISQLPLEHPARRYVVSRQIPTPYHSKLFFCPKFKAWTNTLVPNKFNIENGDEPRLVIPFVDQQGNMFGYQGRAFGSREPRYITIILNEQIPRVYGMESINTAEKVYIVEGPIDSMFLHNCLAMAGSHLDKTVSQIGLKPGNIVVIYDNEPRNKEIVKNIDKVIDQGYNVCLWPSYIQQKDINEMIKSGITLRDIQRVIDEHTYSGLTAKLMLNQWKK